MPRRIRARAWKYFDAAVSLTAGVAFDTIQLFNQYRPNRSFTPRWSDRPLLKSWEKSKPPLGWPRETDSLCPRCVPEIRREILDGRKGYKDLLHAGVHLYAVSVDDAPTARKMVGELGLEYPVLSDAGGGVARAWGVLDETNGIARPATFLIARGGAIAHKEVGHSPSDQPHGYALLEQIKQHLPAETPE